VNVSTDDTERLVTAELERIEEQRGQTLCLMVTEDSASAVRAERLAELCEGEAHWWRVLASHVAGETSLPLVYAQAADRSADSAERRALTWRELAGDYRRTAAGEPGCDVIGCGCGGRCGVLA
jgi:hypothetical protein